MSLELAEEVARVLAGENVRVRLFASVVPTPLLAFAALHFRAAAGVMVTASHNPADYNGYKVYWANGVQIIPPHDEGISRAIEAVEPAASVPRPSLQAAQSSGRLVSIPKDVQTAYLDGIMRMLRRPDVRPPLRIVYTPLHGVGYELVAQALDRAGFPEVFPVTEQVRPDPTFPTVYFPNPEEEGVMDLALAAARVHDADLVLANDPDADRLAVAVRASDGRLLQLTGNQIGTLLGHYLLTANADEAEARSALVVATIVSSPMLGRIARAHGAAYEETLTGFKWIMNRGMAAAAERNARLLFGYEEALGYCVGDLVRDKDGISAATLFAELAAVCRAEGITVLDRLEGLYRRHGLFASAQRCITIRTEEAAQQMACALDGLRDNPPSRIGDREVVAFCDYRSGRKREQAGRLSELGLPPADVLAFELAADGRVVIRPSGTEPKLKVYFDHREQVAQGEDLAAAQARAARAIEALEQAMVRLVPEPAPGLP